MSKALCRTVVVRNSQGLHARPADLLVRMANQFQSTILIGRGGEQVDCKSILSLLTLGAADGTELSVSAEGDDAERAIDSIEQFFLRGFEEPSKSDSETSA
ncbi:HPr family phosphocarrier protein [Roseiconus nitratireducens]|uniref:HPr family phosphocarrier protein n=1 Tax=Roseiconus nitratireducens TaxID=2605748 RepID=A0A5M6D0Q8_9BACT|nr:HPr family phosphocarrier protein [Roseiconus nitratireducens]KAA5541067.1 HPr family phosphocarrier protein [Roseiconus nitratireducens]